MHPYPKTYLMKDIAAFVIIVIIAIAGVSAVVIRQAQRDAHETYYVRGEYGRYCYQEGSVPTTITRPVSFASFEDCKKSIGNTK